MSLRRHRFSLPFGRQSHSRRLQRRRVTFTRLLCIALVSDCQLRGCRSRPHPLASARRDPNTCAVTCWCTQAGAEVPQLLCIVTNSHVTLSLHTDQRATISPCIADRPPTSETPHETVRPTADSVAADTQHRSLCVQLCPAQHSSQARLDTAPLTAWWSLSW